MKWVALSEIVAGLVLLDRLDSNAVNPQDLYPPHNEIIPLKRDGKTTPDIVTRVGFTAWDTAVDAAKKVNGEIPPLEWVRMLEKAASKATAGTKLRPVVDKLMEGEDVDIGVALQAINMIDSGHREMTPMSEVEPKRGKYIKTGYEPLDFATGGLPECSLTIIGAPPGVGKTTLMLEIVKCMVRKYKKKKAAVYSLEMLMAQLAARMLELDETLEEDEKKRILLDESSYTVHEIYALASRTAAHHELAVIAVDFADLMVEGEQSEAAVGIIYKNLSLLAKRTMVPVLLVSQLNRDAYKGGIPKINHLRYSGMAEATGALILLLHNPHNILSDFSSDGGVLPMVEGKGYVIVGKARYGFKQGGVGAVQVDWNGVSGWGSKAHGYWKIST